MHPNKKNIVIPSIALEEIYLRENVSANDANSSSALLSNSSIHSYDGKPNIPFIMKTRN